MKVTKQNLIYRLSFVLCTLSFLVLIATIYSYFQEKHTIIQSAQKRAKQESVAAAKKLEEHLVKIKNNATSIAEELSTGKLKDSELKNRLLNSLQKNPTFFEVGASYAPYVYKPNIRLYSPYYTRKDGKILSRQLEALYDYTKPEYDWYNRPLKEGPVWSEPFYDEDTKVYLIEFDTPFFRINPKTKQVTPAGVVFSNYSLGNVKEIINSLNLGKTGYGFLLSKHGNFVYHPNQQFVEKKFNIFKRADEQKNRKLRDASKKAIAGESTMIDDRSAITGQKTWLFYEPVKSTNFTLGVVFIQDELIGNNKNLDRKLVIITLETIVFLFFLSILSFKAYIGTPKRLWAVSNTTALLLVAGIGTLWTLSLRRNIFVENNNVLVVSPQGTERFLNSQKKIANAQETPLYIPTGVFIQSLKFTEANGIFVKGYIWQKYKDGISKDISRGFTLPEAVNPRIVETYRRREGDTEVIGWYVEATLHQNFDYSTYPLDNKKIGIRLWHKDFDKNVVLVPDFDSYTLISPSTFPGIDHDFLLPGWSLESSYFQYGLHSYNTNFGIKNYIGEKEFPELYYTIYLHRNLIKIFIENLMIPGIVAALLFVILLIFVKRNNENADFNALEIVSVCGGFLFILIIDQISLRQKIITAGLLYLDYFYFLLYLVILLVAIDGLLFVSGREIPLIQYKNNLIPKLLYWPSLLGSLLMITLLVFW